MIELPQVPAGCRVIPLWRNVSGDNWNPIYEIVGYTIVDEVDFHQFNQYRWFMEENPRNGDCYAIRHEKQGKKKIKISMAREILRLPRGAGHSIQADHIDHNTLDNKRVNLRRASPSQSIANTRGRYNSSQRFRCVQLHGGKYQAYVTFNGLRICLATVPKEVGAALMYNYVAIILHDKFAKLNIIPEDEMPSHGCRWELFGVVVEKLRQEGLI